MSGGSQQAPGAAAELMKAMTRLRARLRAESAPSDMSWNWSQLTALGRLVTEGPATTSDLAQAEHVRRQSMGEIVTALRAGGLVESKPDPGDGRKVLIHATPRGRALSENIPVAREAWLNSAITSTLPPDEQQVLLKAAAIMNRLADSGPRPSPGTAD
jgi:DNA-binding MarR family transcriptional regulator